MIHPVMRLPSLVKSHTPISLLKSSIIPRGSFNSTRFFTSSYNNNRSLIHQFIIISPINNNNNRNNIRHFSNSTITKARSETKRKVVVDADDHHSLDTHADHPLKLSPNTGDIQKSGWKEVLRLLRLARRDVKIFAIAVVLLILSAGIVMALPKVTGEILDATKKYSNLEDIKLFGYGLTPFLIIMGTLMFISTVATFGRIIILRVLGEKVVARLRSNIMKKTLSQDMEFYDVNKVGDLISRLSGDAYVVSRSITQNLSDGIKHTIVGVSGITMMMLLSMKLTIVILAFAPPLLWGSYVYGRKIRQISRKLQQATGSLTKIAEEQLNSIKTIQSFTSQPKELHRYDNQIRNVFQIGYTEAMTNATFFASTGVVGNLTFLLTLGYGTHLVMNSMLTVGDLTAFMLYTEYAGGAVFGLANFYSELMKGAGAASRLFELLDRKPIIPLSLGEKLTHSRGEIIFDKLSFAYPTRPNNLIFDEISFKILSGSNVCVVGPSGRGKSTIASLLLRFYNPSLGKILIDGEDITKYSVHSLRANIIGVVQQEPVLMSGTIEENIKYGIPRHIKVSHQEIVEVAKKANCHEFIDRFPDGYNTNIGVRGSLLSGGQKQRIAIARALLKKPAILILDEATSLLDSKSETAVNNTLNDLMRDHSMTTISIAHRLSTIERSDYVLVLGFDGKLAEYGKFKELYPNKDSHLFKLLNEEKKNDEEDLKKKDDEQDDYQEEEEVIQEELRQQQEIEEEEKNHLELERIARNHEPIPDHLEKLEKLERREERERV